MTDEVIITDTGDTGEQPDVKQETPVELRAKELGWRPKEEFHGNEDDFVDAKEFVQRQPLFEKIEHQSRELKNVKKTLDALKSHYTQVKETEYKRALQQLELAKETAINEADGARAVAIEREMKVVEKQFNEIKENQEQDTRPDPAEFIAWQKTNTWYEKDTDMREYADTIGGRLAAKGVAPSEVLAEVAKKVRTMFPQKFTNPNKANAPDVGVSGGGRSSANTEKYELTEMERNIMNTLVKSGTTTKEKYIAELKAIKSARR
jgi:hypothetical protein